MWIYVDTRKHGYRYGSSIISMVQSLAAGHADHYINLVYENVRFLLLFKDTALIDLLFKDTVT